MSPSEASRGQRRWRYYVSQAILQGRREDAGSIARVSAPEIEGRVTEAIRAAMAGDGGGGANLVRTASGAGASEAEADGRDSVEALRAAVERVTIGRAGLLIRLSRQTPEDESGEPTTLSVPWTPNPTRRRREILQGEGGAQPDVRPMRIEARRAFLAAFRSTRLWLDQLVAEPEISVASIAMRERRTERSIRQTLSLAFLDPSLVMATIDGRLPRGFGLKRLMDLPPDWSSQWETLGLFPPAEDRAARI